MKIEAFGSAITVGDADFMVVSCRSLGFNKYMFSGPDGFDYFISSVQLREVELIDVLSDSTLCTIRDKVAKSCW